MKLLTVMCLLLALSSVPAFADTVEIDTDRSGNDIASVSTPNMTVSICQATCQVNSDCAAWTYVEAGIQGPDPFCHLKSPAPPPAPDSCCTSGAILR